MKTHSDREVSKWLKANPGRNVTQYQISSHVSTAYGKAVIIFPEGAVGLDPSVDACLR
jgi:hypothetical protein